MNIMKFNWQWTTAWISLIWLRAGHQVNWTAARLIFPARFDHLHESLFIQFSLKHFGPKEIMIKNVLISISRHNWICQSLDSGLLPQASFYTETGNGTYSNVVVSFRNQIKFEPRPYRSPSNIFKFKFSDKHPWLVICDSPQDFDPNIAAQFSFTVNIFKVHSCHLKWFYNSSPMLCLQT